MLNDKKIPTILKYIAYALILLGAILQTVAMLTSYEAATHYFPVGAPLPILAFLSVLVGALCGVSSAILSDKQATAGSPFSSPYASIASCVGFLLGGILMLLTASDLLSLIAALLLLFSALYAFLTGTSLVRKKPSAMVLLGFLVIAACAVGNVYCYFDVSLEMNAPVKTVLQMALLFSMLYFTGEIRFFLGREKKRLYLILSYCALAACALSAPSIPVSYFLGILPRYDYYALSVVTLGILVSIPLRLLAISCHREIPHPEVTADVSDAQEPPISDTESTHSPCPTEHETSNDTEEQKETDEE